MPPQTVAEEIKKMSWATLPSVQLSVRTFQVLSTFGHADVEADLLCYLAFFGQLQTTSTFGEQLLLFRECKLQVVTRCRSSGIINCFIQICCHSQTQIGKP
jgi:hypothetical protein